jgi:hypothetical protein
VSAWRREAQDRGIFAEANEMLVANALDLIGRHDR